MNKVYLMGRFTKNPEIRYTSDNKAIARFSLAVDKRFKKEGEASADFFNITAFGKTAETIEKFCAKGTKILAECEIHNNNYQKDSQTVYSDQITLNNFYFCESKGSSEPNNNPAPSPSSDDGFMYIPSDLDELPFN